METKDTFQYVPILDSIASILGNKDLYEEVTSYFCVIINIMQQIYLLQDF